MISGDLVRDSTSRMSLRVVDISDGNYDVGLRPAQREEGFSLLMAVQILRQLDLRDVDRAT